MEEKIAQLEQKVDNLQKTLEWMIEGMIRAQSIRGEWPEEIAKFDGGPIGIGDLIGARPLK